MKIVGVQTGGVNANQRDHICRIIRRSRPNDLFLVTGNYDRTTEPLSTPLGGLQIWIYVFVRVWIRVLVSQGQNIADAIRQIGVSEVTYYRWRQEYGGLKTDQVKRLKELEQEHGNQSALMRDCENRGY
jgi:Transposase